MIILYKKLNIHPILLAWGVAFIVFEFLSVNIIRIYLHRNLFKPGQDHIHHIFLNNTKSKLKTNFILILINVFIAINGYLSFYFINELFSLFFYIIIFIFYLLFRLKIMKNKKNLK